MQEPEQSGAESQSDKDRRTGNIVLLLFLVILGYAELLRRQHERVLERARAAQFEAFVPA